MEMFGTESKSDPILPHWAEIGRVAIVGGPGKGEPCGWAMRHTSGGYCIALDRLPCNGGVVIVHGVGTSKFDVPVFITDEPHEIQPRVEEWRIGRARSRGDNAIEIELFAYPQPGSFVVFGEYDS